MNKRYLGAVVGIIVVVVVGGALFMSTRSKVTTTASPTPSPTSTPVVKNPAQPSPGGDTDPTGNDGKNTRSEVANAKPSDSKAEAKPDLSEEDLQDDETIARLLKQFGSYAELYKAISPTQREELIDWLDGEEKLREHFGDFLPIERDSDLRAYMIRRVEPKGLWEGDEHSEEEDYVDTELMALLDKPTDSPIKPEEWQARTDLAMLTDLNYALSWTREAKRAHPDDVAVNLQAASTTMIIGASIEGVGQTEKQDAEKYLRESLSSDQASNLTSDEKVKGYYGLYWSSDREATREWFREQLARENDPKAKQTLENLLARLDRNLARTQ